METKHKAGFVNIVGNPNTGKSTLMNAMVGERLSIISSKSQTTRHRIKGIVSTDEYQIVFSDTPGVIQPNYGLQESMLKFSKSALNDADILIYVTDIYETSDKNADFLEKIKKLEIPIILIINKIDISKQEEVVNLINSWQDILPKAEIFAISALKNFNVQSILNRIIELLPESPPYFPKDQLTDLDERFFVSEIIREKILINFKKEIPYSVEIEVEEFKQQTERIYIRAIIYVERKSQKGIIIGHQGNAIKRIRIESEKSISEFMKQNIKLELFVKVAEKWRHDKKHLDRFGYNPK